jgi:hypothetical protein
VTLFFLLYLSRTFCRINHLHNGILHYIAAFCCTFHLVTISYCRTCNTMFYKILLTFTTLKVNHYMFRLIWSSSAVTFRKQSCSTTHNKREKTHQFKSRSKTHKREHNPPTHTHVGIETTCIFNYVSNNKRLDSSPNF